MGSRVPVQHYNMRSPPPSSFIGGSPLHDLNNNAVDSRSTKLESIGGGDAVVNDSLDNDDDSSAVVSDCIHESYSNSLPIHGVGVEEERSSLDNDGSSSSRAPYDILSLQGSKLKLTELNDFVDRGIDSECCTDLNRIDFGVDVSPIESSRARFLQLVVDHFISEHVIEAIDSEGGGNDYSAQSGQDKLNKRKLGEVQLEGDPRFALPLMYIANMYQTLVHEVDTRLASVGGFREKTIGVALEAAGGLYRLLAKKFPKKGSCTFKRRELATSLETRTRFPELVVQEEKRVRFVVVNGLDIVEKPNSLPIDDAEWFIRLTGRNEVAVSARDFKFYSPRHKYRRVPSNSSPNMMGLPTYPGPDNSSMLAAAQGFRSVNEPQNQQETPSKHHHMQPLSLQPQFQTVHQNHHQSMHQSQHAVHYSQNHECGPTSHLPEIPHAHHSPTISQHIACLQHVGGRLHVLPSNPAKFCDECGTQYLRETSKFCSECGVKRLGI